MGFAAGNAKKLLGVPMLGVGAIASMLVPRNSTHWVLASATEPGEGVVPLAAAASAQGVRVSWLVANEQRRSELRASGQHALPKRGPRAWWATLRAGTVIVTHGLGDAHPAGLRGARIVQLWHGIPLKKLHLDATLTYQLPSFWGSRRFERALRAASQRAYRRIGFFVAASEASASRLQSAFGLAPEQMLIAGDPRDDVLFSPEARVHARSELARALGRKLPDRIVLIAPTWREGANDPMVPSRSEWAALEAWAAERDALVLVRPHPLASSAFAAGLAGAHAPHLALLDARAQADITPVLPAVETLVTDYSSVAYDFALLGRGMVFLAPDLEEYQASRGFYEPYAHFAGGEPARSWPEAIDRLSALDQPGERARAERHSIELASRMHAFRDGRNTQRVLAALLRQPG